MAEELRVETNRVFKHNCHFKLNIAREKTRALKELKQEKDRILLTVDMGVVPENHNYINKPRTL